MRATPAHRIRSRLAFAPIVTLAAIAAACGPTQMPSEERDMTLPRVDLRKPDLAMPDLVVEPDLAMPDLAAPDLTMPDLATPDLATPDLSTAPDLTTRDLAQGPDLTPAADLLKPIDLAPADLARCANNTDCPTALPRCDTNTGRCVACLVTADCTAANATTSCTNNACAIVSCAGNFRDCDGSYANGCEVDTASDVKHCGACNAACAAGGRCGTLVNAFDGSPPTNWSFNGSASNDNNNVAILTVRGASNTAGSVFYKTAIPVDAFELVFQLRIDTLFNQHRADGMGFVLQKTAANAVGRNGGGMGMAGLDGYGVELDIFNNQTCLDANGNHIGIDRLIVCDQNVGTPTPLATSGDVFQSLGDIADYTWREVKVQVSAAKMTVSMAGKPVLTDVPLTGLKSGDPYWFGFAAGTGGPAAGQEVKSVKLTFPTPRCL